jgi:hypothetical protein
MGQRPTSRFGLVADKIDLAPAEYESGKVIYPYEKAK